jgi:subtilisin family serine protease
MAVRTQSRRRPSRGSRAGGEGSDAPQVVGAGRRIASTGGNRTGGEASDGPLIISSLSNAPGRTGRKLVLLAEGDIAAGEKALWNAAGVKAQGARESGRAAPPDGFATIYPKLGIAVVSADPDRADKLRASAGEGTALPEEPEEEYILYAAGMDAAWLRGYRDAVAHLSAGMLDEAAPAAAGGGKAAPAAGNPSATWGVRATRCAESPRSGAGVRIAVLDTGLDLRHPDFANRRILHQSFVPNEQVQDRNGHGTHCAGIAFAGGGPSATFTRYGVAGAAELLVGKVLSDVGEGEEGWILAGIEWAIQQGCRVVSMSLSAQAPPSRLFERIGQRALKANTLLIAAAGNDSNRPSRIFPVGYPANADSIMAVAAVDHRLGVARFSNGDGLGGAGGHVDVAGPGVGVMSAFPGARLYKQESGTSMATPFVAGIAALLAEGDPSLKAVDLFKLLQSTALKLPGSRREDVGAGLVQAPT